MVNGFQGQSVYFIRHGQSQANARSVFGLDLPLSEEGVEQAYRLKEQFADIDRDIGLVVSSIQRRAVDTALYMFPGRNVFLMDRRFREIDFGKLEGASIEDDVVREIQLNPRCIYTKYEGDDVWKRAKEALAALRNFVLLADKDVALVGHDTLFECMLDTAGYYKAADSDMSPFVLWSSGCRFPNAGFIRIDASFLFGKDEGRCSKAK